MGKALEEFEKVTNLKLHYFGSYNSVEDADIGGADFIISIKPLKRRCNGFFPDWRIMEV